MNIGEKLRKLRKSKKLTQEALAEFMNVSPQAVSKWETGASSPDIDMLPALAAFYETTVDDLLDFDRRRIDAEVDAIVTQSVPLRSEPEKAEAFYREALRKYPNNEVLLNCLLMVIPNSRLGEKLELGERLLESSRSVKKMCRWHIFSVGRSGYAARREVTGCVSYLTWAGAETRPYG